ncbi:hypothetical protein M0802_003702 [Mischocyttarus mexicanus]|nr:hypothetical protein M0802_003702 [Mischocyttarus mexicanus]
MKFGLFISLRDRLWRSDPYKLSILRMPMKSNDDLSFPLSFSFIRYININNNNNNNNNDDDNDDDDDDDDDYDDKEDFKILS